MYSHLPCGGGGNHLKGGILDDQTESADHDHDQTESGTIFYYFDEANQFFLVVEMSRMDVF